jgi:DNA-binding transcriptional ArsR family regulator
MTGDPEQRRLDATSLIALAHPLRVRLRDHLRRAGPATATQLAKAFGESSGATSYHLRMLARHGFIEDDPDHPGGRERWWRVTPGILQIGTSDFLEDEASREALHVVTNEYRRLADARLQRWLSDQDRWSTAWLEASSDSTYAARLSAAQAAALRDELDATIRRHAQLEPGPGDRLVEIQLNLFPTGEPA